MAEDFDMESRGAIAFGDNRLHVTDARVDGPRFSMWADYRLSDAQKRRTGQWRAGKTRNLQGLGRADLRPPEGGSADGWIAEKREALEDAARSGIRSLLKGRERNRPQRVKGRIALAEFPRFYFAQGQWAVSARFRVEIIEIEAFPAY
jgi:hypothetical protein